MKRNYIYKGWTTLNLFKAFQCAIGKHEWKKVKEATVCVGVFTIDHYKCERCNAICSESGIEPLER